MAVLNIRVDDRVRDQLKEMADDEGVTLSEFVRDLLMEAVVPVYDDEDRGRRRSEEPAPESMRLVDRQMLSLLHRILARVLPEDANDVDGDREYQLMRAQILEDGFTSEYSYEVAGFRTELSRRDCRRVIDILQMFWILTYSIDHLVKEGTPVDEELARALEFQGFDFNDSLEGHMADYVAFQMRDGDRWTELQPQIERHDNGNSHSPMLDTYMRMLTEYRRIMDSRDQGSFDRLDYLLSAEELQQIRDARVHPSRR
ncbi:YfbU family protein [Brachybacterium sp. EF45031]|uniref:YfbU family protein n=1 Tax=Brachybacterium sillae TaxID=2810536 RepID=UPI00217E8AC2|nr:YfbU family protein [Brachybacterium sillae]MCS6711299.1 YfbU family protein [Brachybacterium sillae]